MLPPHPPLRWPSTLHIGEARRRRLSSAAGESFRSTCRRLRLPSVADGLLDSLYAPLAGWLEERRADDNCHVVGVSGGQGSGKTTLAELLETVLVAGAGYRVARFSIDDLYLPRAERQRLSHEVHPLLAVRGVPGTHDVRHGLELFERLRSTDDEEPIPIPRFDKSRDDPHPGPDWPRFEGPADFVLFEGWFVGLEAQADEELHGAVNALERSRDPRGRWRRFVNDRLSSDYRRLFAEIDTLIFLEVPSFEKVLEWRRLQEEKLIEARGKTPESMSPEEIAEFVQYYERLTRHALRRLPHRADVCLRIDDDHRIHEILAGPGAVAGRSTEEDPR